MHGRGPCVSFCLRFIRGSFGIPHESSCATRKFVKILPFRTAGRRRHDQGNRSCRVAARFSKFRLGVIRPQVVALVRGTAVGQDGKSATITAPSGPAQEKCIQAALRDAELRPEDVSYVSCFSTTFDKTCPSLSKRNDLLQEFLIITTSCTTSVS